MPLWQPQQAIARPAYFDREPLPIVASYAGVAAPAASTVRATYTPPYGFAAFIEQFYLFTYKNTASAPVNLMQLYVEFLPFTGGTYRVNQVQSNSNVLNEPFVSQNTGFGYMAYGDTIRIVTYDGSTGGTQAYTGVIKGTEFLY